MSRKKNRTAVRAAFIYLLLAGGSWMFVDSYANSYNKLTEDKIAPASVVISGSSVRLGIMEHSAELDLTALDTDSKLYCAAYLLSPDELRLACHLIAHKYRV